jgi:PleD family two-component response regulator
MNENQRLYPRLAFDCPAQCSFIDSFPETFPVTIIDIGPEGFGFFCDRPLKIGDSIYVIIDLGAGGKVKFITKVRWSQGVPNSSRFKIGAKIIDTSNEDLEKFVRFYCRRLIPGQQRKNKVLIIEGDKENAKQLQDELIKCRYDVICAHDGQDGFSKYITGRPDLIILDYALPKLSGYEICRKIRRLQNDKDVMIFMLIAKKKDIAKIDGKNIGIQKYFLKPVQTDQLVNEVNGSF